MAVINVTLSTGEMTGSTDKLTVKEWRGLKSPLFSNDQDDLVVLKCYPSLTKEAIASMTFDDYRRLVVGIYDGLKVPLEKNSPSASTST